MCFLGQIQIVKFFLQLYFTKFILKFLDKKLLTENFMNKFSVSNLFYAKRENFLKKLNMKVKRAIITTNRIASGKIAPFKPMVSRNIFKP